MPSLTRNLILSMQALEERVVSVNTNYAVELDHLATRIKNVNASVNKLTGGHTAPTEGDREVIEERKGDAIAIKKREDQKEFQKLNDSIDSIQQWRLEVDEAVAKQNLAHKRLEDKVDLLEQRAINAEYDHQAYCMLHDEDFISGDEELEASDLGKYYMTNFEPEWDGEVRRRRRAIDEEELLGKDKDIADKLRADNTDERSFSRGDLLLRIIRNPTAISAPNVARALNRWKLWRDEKLLLCLKE